MRLGKFTFGYIVTTGIAAVIFILLVKFVGKRFPGLPVFSALGRTI